MANVFASITMSLDGFIAGKNDNPRQGLGENGDHLHDWIHMGGDVDGMRGLPNVQLAILRGTMHVSAITKTDLLLPMITSFLKGAKDSINKDFQIE